MNEAKKYTIEILGNEYVIHSDESQEHIIHATACVQRFLDDIVAHNTHIDPKKAAVLAALRMASHIVHLEDKLSHTESKGKALVNELEGILCNAC